ncbi:MAG: T9SS type A sorting domain-containing protein [Ignavibacteria bacterium]|nr:T9SS type A sorting domain-containing protein [Ignavibacteria bacterium]
MKKVTLIALALLLQQALLYTQWQQIATIGNNDLRAVKFFNEFTGIVVGQGGIWRSTNAGVNWTPVQNGVNLNSISFPDINNGYAVGDSGKIFKSTDNGQTWYSQISNVQFDLYSVSFINNNTGHAVGNNGIILRTQLGGSSWYQNTNPVAENVNCIQMITNSTVIACGSVSSETFLSTGNGGTNWIYTLGVAGNHLNALSKIPMQPNGSNIVAVGSNGRIRKSTNSGGSWAIINSPVSYQFNGIIFIDSLIGYIAGDNGAILFTSTGGNNWITQSSSSPSNLKSLSFINSLTGWVVGSSGVVLRKGIPVGVPEQEVSLPESFYLYQNYPNPFNPSTIIRFKIFKPAHYDLKVFEIKGGLISTLFDKFLQNGTYEMSFFSNYSFQELPTGVYFYTLKSSKETISKKMLLIK